MMIFKICFTLVSICSLMAGRSYLWCWFSLKTDNKNGLFRIRLFSLFNMVVW